MPDQGGAPCLNPVFSSWCGWNTSHARSTKPSNPRSPKIVATTIYPYCAHSLRVHAFPNSQPPAMKGHTRIRRWCVGLAFSSRNVTRPTTTLRVFVNTFPPRAPPHSPLTRNKQQTHPILPPTAARQQRVVCKQQECTARRGGRRTEAMPFCKVQNTKSTPHRLHANSPLCNPNPIDDIKPRAVHGRMVDEAEHNSSSKSCVSNLVSSGGSCMEMSPDEHTRSNLK